MSSSPLGCNFVASLLRKRLYSSLEVDTFIKVTQWSILLPTVTVIILGDFSIAVPFRTIVNDRRDF